MVVSPLVLFKPCRYDVYIHASRDVQSRINNGQMG